MTSSATGVRRRERLARAQLYLCTDARTDRGDLGDFLHAALAGGVDIVQLRDKSLDAVAELELQATVMRVAREFDALVAVNDRADLAAVAGADAYHAGQRDVPPGSARTLLGPDVIIGRSTHSAAQAAAAEADADVDYFCVGPVWETPTKPGRPAVGVVTVSAVAKTNPQTPWFAIGGIDADSIDDVVAAGARRVVVVRAITEAADPQAAAARLKERLLAADAR